MARLSTNNKVAYDFNGHWYRSSIWHDIGVFVLNKGGMRDESKLR
jgi:hypothetical protein